MTPSSNILFNSSLAAARLACTIGKGATKKGWSLLTRNRYWYPLSFLNTSACTVRIASSSVRTCDGLFGVSWTLVFILLCLSTLFFAYGSRGLAVLLPCSLTHAYLVLLCLLCDITKSQSHYNTCLFHYLHTLPKINPTPVLFQPGVRQG